MEVSASAIGEVIYNISAVDPPELTYAFAIDDPMKGNLELPNLLLFLACLLCIRNKRAMALFTCVNKGNKNVAGFWKPRNSLRVQI